jgi:hypothetical protein
MTEQPQAAPEEYARAQGGVIPFTTGDRERQIPLHSFDLQRFLFADPALSPGERELWRGFGQLFAAVLHHDYLSWASALLDLYSPLDPDTETVAIEGSSRLRTEDSDEKFLKAFETVMLRANFRELHMAEVLEAIKAPNEVGLNYQPNFELFEHLRVFARGRTRVTRTVRNLRTRMRRKQVELEGFRRMVVVVKFRPSKQLDAFARTDVVYLRLFKDVPFVDMEMHLPEQGTRVKMRGVDKAQIASPFFVGLPALAFKLFTASLISPMALGAAVVAPISAGVKSFFGFRQAKQKHLHHMIRNLYYLTLANNVGVLHWLVAEAQEEDLKEALLAYFYASKNLDDPRACTMEAIDREVERLLERLTHLPINFEADDALNTLVRFGLVQPMADGSYHPLPLASALQALDERWDRLFLFSRGSQPAARAEGR